MVFPETSFFLIDDASEWSSLIGPFPPQLLTNHGSCRTRWPALPWRCPLTPTRLLRWGSSECTQLWVLRNAPTRFDPFQSEWEALEVVNHRWALESVEEELMSRDLNFGGIFSANKWFWSGPDPVLWTEPDGSPSCDSYPTVTRWGSDKRVSGVHEGLKQNLNIWQKGNNRTGPLRKPGEPLIRTGVQRFWKKIQQNLQIILNVWFRFCFTLSGINLESGSVFIRNHNSVKFCGRKKCGRQNRIKPRDVMIWASMAPAGFSEAGTRTWSSYHGDNGLEKPPDRPDL